MILTKSQRAATKAATREKILVAARQLVSERGFAAATTLDVARRASLSHGGVFVHFPTREALLAACVEEFGKRMGVRLHALAENDAGLAERLKSHLSAIRAEEAFYTAIVRERSHLPQAARDTFTGVESMVSHHFEGCFGKGGAENPAHALFFNTWIALVHHYLANRDLFAKTGESVVEHWGETLVHHFVSLINKEQAMTKTCISCGMPMTKPADFPNGDTTKDYCVHCARPDGSMQSFAEKRASMAAFIVQTQGLDEAVALRAAEAHMRRQPAWRSA